MPDTKVKVSQVDIYFDSTPIFTLIGIILGVITAVYTAYKKIKDVNKS